MDSLKQLLSKGEIIRALIVTVIAVSTLGIWKFNESRQQSASSENITELAAVEIREYEGEDLSSIKDFRENSIKGPQYVNKEEYRLKIHGLVDEEQNLTYEQVLNQDIYKKVVTLYCVEGWDVTILWEGVLLKDLLEQAGIDDTVKVVIFRAADEYSTSLSLEYVLDNNILLAYKMNDVELPPERGFPFQVVAESKWGYKWAKWVTEIELSADKDFEGYWEQRGYHNEGDTDGPIFEE